MADGKRQTGLFKGIVTVTSLNDDDESKSGATRPSTNANPSDQPTGGRGKSGDSGSSSGGKIARSSSSSSIVMAGVDLSSLKMPRQYEVRVYVIKGTRLTPMDGVGDLSDPFLQVR